ncbi:MAG: hypothetical protein DMF76_04855 [Acidobacteria bacterium]|nr:MAG: hypothetical protein DMF76_04855 [Acidobacteriota bacterium]
MVIKIIKVILAIGLVGGLFLPGWNIYRRLPDDSPSNTRANRDAEPGIEVTIALSVEPAPIDSRVEVYPLDFAALQRDYFASPLAQKRFDDFLGRRLKGLEPVRARFDENKRANVKLTLGNWWVRATAEMPNGESLEWRLSINLSGQGQTLELTTENVYEKTKKF